MNDFLQSIRNGNFSKDNRPRYNQQKPRRNYDNGNGNSNNNRNNGNDRKFRNRNDSQQASEETYKGIKEALDSIVKNQVEGLEVAKRRATAEERKASAFEFIASKFGNFSADQTESIKAVETMVKAEIVTEESPAEPVIEKTVVEKTVDEKTVDASGLKSYEIIKNDDKDMNKDEILAMILSMRNDGSTYNEIASHLASLDLPTFSGRGKWHAQTIHRLCQSF